MKRLRFTGLTVMVVAVGLVLAACNGDETADEAAPEPEDEEVEEEEPDDDPDDVDEAADGDPIRIGFLSPMTGPVPLAGQDAENGLELFWEQHDYEVAGRPVEYILADTGCDPDGAITQARRLIDQEDVHLIIGPLCGSEAEPVAGVSADTGVPVFINIAGGGPVTQPSEVDTTIRLGPTSSQGGHPFGEWLYEEAGCRDVFAFGTDYTHGHETLLSTLYTFEEAGGNVLDVQWQPFGTTDFGPYLGSIPDGTDCVVPVAAGVEQPILLEQWFDFGLDDEYEIYSPFWMQEDTMPEMDDRAVGIVGGSMLWAGGLDTPEAQEFVNAFAEEYGYVPAIYAEYTYSAALWLYEAMEMIDGNVEDTDALLDAVRSIEIDAPRGPLRLDEQDNPIQNVYITQVEMVDHPVLGETLMNVPIETIEEVSQFWTYDPDEFMDRMPYLP